MSKDDARLELEFAQALILKEEETIIGGDDKVYIAIAIEVARSDEGHVANLSEGREINGVDFCRGEIDLKP
jgi:hypothetical protein